MYRAFYRKYRPSTFTDVVGQEHITKTLENAVKTSMRYFLAGVVRCAARRSLVRASSIAHLLDSQTVDGCFHVFYGYAVFCGEVL